MGCFYFLSLLYTLYTFVHVTFTFFTAPTTKPSDDCIFPFKYRGKTYDKCTKVRHNQLWCSKDAVYKGRWKNCKGLFEISLFMLLLRLVYTLTTCCL